MTDTAARRPQVVSVASLRVQTTPEPSSLTEALTGDLRPRDVVPIRVPFAPVGQPRGRAIPTAGGGARVISAPGKHPVRQFKAVLRIMADAEFAAREIAPYQWAGLIVDGVIPRPRSHWTKGGRLTKRAPPWPGKPDVDNVLKAVMDGLNGIAYPDDARVAWEAVTCRYHPEQGASGHVDLRVICAGTDP